MVREVVSRVGKAYGAEIEFGEGRHGFEMG